MMMMMMVIMYFYTKVKLLSQNIQTL